QHRLRCGQGRKSERVGLQLLQGGGDWSHQVARQGAREAEHHGQLRHARGSQDADLRPGHPAAHRLHAAEDSHGPVAPRSRDRIHGVLAVHGGCLLQHRRGVRPVRGTRHVLMLRAASLTTANRLSEHAKGVLLMIGATLCWSSAGTLVRSMHLADAWEITFWRSLFMTLFVLGVLFAQYRGATLERIRAVGRPGLVVGALWALMY